MKIAQEQRLISGTALLQPLEFLLSRSLFYSFFYISYAEISLSPGNCPLVFFPRIAIFHLSPHCLLHSSPPSILVSKYPFLPLCFLLLFTVNLSSSVSPAVALCISLSPCPAPLFSLRGKGGGKCPRGDVFVVGGREGEGLHRISGEGNRSGKGMKGRMGRA